MFPTLHGAVADALRQRITDGIYPIGSRLPSISALQDEFGVKGINTIRQAQQTLVDEGLLRTAQGVGAWVIAQDSAALSDRQLLADLHEAQATITRAITHLQNRLDQPASSGRGE